MATKKNASDSHQFFLLQSYSRELVELFQQAITQANPALYLYQHKTRTPLFMMESLLRLLQATYPDKAIKNSLKIIKQLEDQIGEIDNYDQQCQKFSKHKTIETKYLVYFESKREKALLKLNKELKKQNYFQDVFNILLSHFRINFNNETLVLKFQDELKWELKTAVHFFMERPKKFKDMELEVHELRRKLRWISIYGQSLQGIVILKKEKVKNEWETHFPLHTIKNKAYNKLPLEKKFKEHIYLSQSAFTALNIVVEKLGEIKDKGLDLQALQRAIIKTKDISKKKAAKIATKELEIDYSEKNLLKEAHELLHNFFVTCKIQDDLFVGN